MSKRADSALSTTTTCYVDLWLTLRRQIFYSHVINRSQILDFILSFQVDRFTWIETWDRIRIFFVQRTVLAEDNHGIFLVIAIFFELIRRVITAFTSKEEEASFECVDARARRHCVEKLDTHRMHILFSEVQVELVQVSILALKHEEKGFEVESGVRGHEKASRKIMPTTKWYIADPILVIDFLVDKEVFTHDNDASWSDITRHLDEHVCSFVDRIYVLPDYMIQAEVHLV